MIVGRILVLALATGLSIAPAYAGEWVCIADKATGFKFSNEKWNSVDFNVEGKTFIVSEVEPYIFGSITNVGVEVTEAGNSAPSHRCPPLASDAISCGGLGWGFLFDKASLRYQETYGVGYVHAEDSPENTPYIEIGKCTKLR